MILIQYMFGIRSMRKTIEEVEPNLAYSWFLGFGFHYKVPNFSTFGKNYERRFKDTDLFEQIFCEILNQERTKSSSIQNMYLLILPINLSTNIYPPIKTGGVSKTPTCPP